MSKPKIAFYWCASCGGCEEAVVDLAEAILDVVQRVDIVFWPCAMDFKQEDLEALADQEITACFLNGAVRSSQQRAMAELCRRKSRLVVAFGSCAHTGGVPGLANLYTLDSILETSYGRGGPSNVNPEGVLPQARADRAEGLLELPILDEEVKALDQCVPVDYYLPGCPPPVNLIADAVTAILRGELPPRGAVLAPDVALCNDCPRIGSKPEEPFITEFKRPHEVPIDPETCFLAQGLICMGPATRRGCGHACIEGNMPCSGCLGPLSRVRDQGAAALSAIASLAAGNEAEAVAAMMDKIPDPVGTFYRYGVPASLLFKHARPHGKGGVAWPAE